MSYDVTFETDEDITPDGAIYERRDGATVQTNDDRVWVPAWRNYTSNVSPMWALALGETLGDLIDRCPISDDLLPHIERGVAAMRADPDVYRSMNPKNGWGSYEGALAYLEWIAAACRVYPCTLVRVSR